MISHNIFMPPCWIPFRSKAVSKAWVLRLSVLFIHILTTSLYSHCFLEKCLPILWQWLFCFIPQGVLHFFRMNQSPCIVRSTLIQYLKGYTLRLPFHPLFLAKFQQVDLRDIHPFIRFILPVKILWDRYIFRLWEVAKIHKKYIRDHSCR